MRIRREVVGALVALCVTACAAAAEGPGDGSSGQTIPTVVNGVGLLPEPLPTVPGATHEPTTALSSSTTTLPGTTTTALHAEGNRILLLGDSILASTSRRYTNDTCNALVPLGWRVEVEAEVSRGISFGNEVLAKRMSAGWDVGVVFLGTNDGGNSNEYLKALNKIITNFAPRPVVLITVGEFKPEMRGINDTIRAIAKVYPDRVSVLDWNKIVTAYPELLNVDGIHPTPAGRQVLAQAIAAHVGPAPTSPGECLKSKFTDDSAGSVDGGAGSVGTGTTVRPRTTPTTVKPSGGTTTTVKPSGGSSTTVAGATSTTVGGTTATTVGGTTATTAAPGTTAAPTIAPTTAAPTTAAPTTAAPPTTLL